MRASRSTVGTMTKLNDRLKLHYGDLVDQNSLVRTAGHSLRISLHQNIRLATRVDANRRPPTTHH